MQGIGWARGLKVTADAKGLVGHAGVVLPRRAADVVGLTSGLSVALASPVGLVFSNRVVGLGSHVCGWGHGGMPVSFADGLTRTILTAVAAIARREVSSAAGVLILRHENTLLRRHVKKVCHRPQDRLWFAALPGAGRRRSSR